MVIIVIVTIIIIIIKVIAIIVAVMIIGCLHNVQLAWFFFSHAFVL